MTWYDDANPGTEVGREARRTVGRIDHLDRMFLRDEHIDQIRLRVDVEMVLSLVDQQYRARMEPCTFKKAISATNMRRPALHSSKTVTLSWSSKISIRSWSPSI